MPHPDKDDALARAELMLTLRKRGIGEPALMRAVEAVPRDRFVEPDCRHLAWLDRSLPIACGQTISQPSVVARMTEALDIAPSHTVLEIGTGTGYHTALLARLARRVVSVERFRSLATAARERLRRLDVDNVEIVVADGIAGWAAAAPYDRILIGAAIAEIPPALLGQLAEGGVLVGPVGAPDAAQNLARFARGADGIVRRDLMPVRFVPLVPGIAAVL